MIFIICYIGKKVYLYINIYINMFQLQYFIFYFSNNLPKLNVSRIYIYISYLCLFACLSDHNSGALRQIRLKF